MEEAARNGREGLEKSDPFLSHSLSFTLVPRAPSQSVLSGTKDMELSFFSTNIHTIVG